VKIVIESTNRITELITPSGVVPARLWEGTTDSGIPIQVLVTRIAVHRHEDTAQFERELLEQHPPSAAADAFPARLVL
jgi:hypothetical protein